MPNEVDQHPASGVRVHFELIDGDENSARYRCSLFTHDARFDCTLAMKRDGITIDGWQGGTPSAPHAEIAQAIAKTVAKSALGETPVVWPRKITRWRNK